MNAPHFNVANLPLEAGTMAYMKAVLAEEERCCGGIDKRIRESEAEYLSINSEVRRLAKDIDSLGFFERLRIRQMIKTLECRASSHRKVLEELYDARWRRTYG